MPSPITNLGDQQPAATATAALFETWFDPIETAVRERVHGFIQAMIEAELDEALSRTRYARGAKACPGSKSGTPDGETAAGDAPLRGHRHGHRSRSLMGTFGAVEINVPRARIEAPDGKTREWKSKTLPAYQRRTKAADALIAGAYLAGTNERTFIVSDKRSLLTGSPSACSAVWRPSRKDTVSRVWRKVKTDWEGWNQRSLADESIVRLILDGTVVRVRLERTFIVSDKHSLKKATTICLLVVLGIRADGQKVLLAVKNMGGETAQAWRVVPGDLIKRGLRKPEFLIVDGGSGLERALAELWSDVPTQRCTVHKHRNLLAHAPSERLPFAINAH